MKRDIEKIRRDEVTRDPIFLLQSRDIVFSNREDYMSADGDYESGYWIHCLTNRDKEAEQKYFEGDADLDGTFPEPPTYFLDLEGVLERGDAQEIWKTESIWLTREEATVWAEEHEYRFRMDWRVFCLCAEGQLTKLLHVADTDLLGCLKRWLNCVIELNWLLPVQSLTAERYVKELDKTE